MRRRAWDHRLLHPSLCCFARLSSAAAHNAQGNPSTVKCAGRLTLAGAAGLSTGCRSVLRATSERPAVLCNKARPAAMSSKQPLGATPAGGMSALRRHARTFLEHGIEQVLPNALVTKAVQREGDALRVSNQLVPLAHNAYLVGFGKAVGGMANVMQTLLADHLVEGVISVPQGTRQIAANMNRPEMLPDPAGPIKVLEGAKDNVPDDKAVAAATAIVALMQKLKNTDILIVLISG
ncbi:hypothetical protein HPB50_004565 [Hyalomma asiaticum]|uniref:Uncharacterized protein n=1 Tax=Hyalomma asiaticum TaxID=266040 RepID=A0ACB7RX84_HYAAI|nr:hypothetical protein HPB50_004565 [Hyalomma asiaticum]